MKIIELLNKIANGEELPKKIYCFNREFYLKENIYFGDTFTLMHYIQEEDLNDEVEIMEEETRDIEVCGSLFTKTEYDKLAHSEEEKKIPEKLEILPDNEHYSNEVLYGKINIYKVDDRYTSHAKFIPITKEIFFKDYTNKGKYHDGIKLEEYDYESGKYKFRNIKVNDIYYYHIGRVIPEFEKLIEEKLDKLKRYTFELNNIKDEVANLINQEKNIKKFIEDYNSLKDNLESKGE